MNFLCDAISGDFFVNATDIVRHTTIVVAVLQQTGFAIGIHNSSGYAEMLGLGEGGINANIDNL